MGRLIPLAGSIARDITDLGFDVSQVRPLVSVYLAGRYHQPRGNQTHLAMNFWLIPSLKQYSFDLKLPVHNHSKDHHVVEIAYNPGVMDPVEASTIKGIRDLSVQGITAVRTAKQYHIYGKLSAKEIRDPSLPCA